ncbi:MAG: polyprenyl synthetase family protein [Phycisphaerales bacterium]|nr:polyprenyl synthetase family protein [Phycisphaerales bacterium]MCB9840836.1 polyprenyl synthetase family protein [Phycisphaeraceae bacterium]
MRGVLDIPDELRPVGEMLGGALVRVEKRFEEALSADLEPVAALCRHVEAYRGKMLRPTLAILCGCAADGRSEGAVPDADALPETLIAVAGVVEMVHMATLVHDDVLDEADTRRRGATVNSLHGNESAVILGDYLIAAAYHWCATLDDPHYARRIGRVSMDLCSGELLQLSRRRDFALSERTYFDIVSRKTGALVAVACELGARAMGAESGVQQALFGFGRDLGVAFQIQDDLLDLTGDEATVGKSVRKDLEKGKLTLPLIHHLATGEPERRRTTLAYLEAATQSGHEDPAGDADLMAALDQTGSIRYAEATAERLVDQARSVLRGLPESAVVAMLGTMADAVVHRAF